jgi:hypothetical protein
MMPESRSSGVGARRPLLDSGPRQRILTRYNKERSRI